MVNLTGHEAGNGGYSQGTPKAHRAFLYSDSQGTPTARRAFLYSEIAHRRIVAGWEILRNHGRNNNCQAQVPTRCTAGPPLLTDYRA
jgi:hypothetical protein